MNHDEKIYSVNDIKRIVTDFTMHQKKNPNDPMNFYSKGVEDVINAILTYNDFETKIKEILYRADVVTNIIGVDNEPPIMVWIISRTKEPITQDEKPLITRYYNTLYPGAVIKYTIDPNYKKGE